MSELKASAGSFPAPLRVLKVKLNSVDEEHGWQHPRATESMVGSLEGLVNQ
jgi:hypothetical protein